MKRRVEFLFLLAVLLFPWSVLAQAYPNRYITIVGGGAGGAQDLVVRTVGAELSKILGQQIVVENRPGTGGIVGAEAVARAAPNGYTLLVGGMGPNAIAPSLYPNLPYDAIKDFAPIILLSENPSVLVVHPSVPAKTVAELIGLARQRPEKLTCASSGNGTAQHLALELFKSMAKVNILHVPYRGIPAAVNSVIAGETDLMFPPIFNAIPLMKAGKLRVLGVTTIKRSAVLPDVPTIAESGVAGYEQTAWNALFAPAGTPPAIISKLNDATTKALMSKDVKSKLESLGATVIASTPEQLAEHVKKEIDKWGKVIKESGAKVD